MEKLFNLLESAGPLSPELRQYLQSIIKIRQLAKNDFLLKAGHICMNICFVESGLIRCYYNKGDKEVCSWFMKEGDLVISIESFYQQKESYEFIQALENCTIACIGYSELNYIYLNFPEFNFVGRLMTEKYYQLWANQLYALRMNQAPERYQWLLNNHADLVLRVKAKYLASYLGITEVMLSKIKGKNNFL